MKARALPESLTTERLLLRRHTATDAPVMFAAVDTDRPRLRAYLPWVDLTLTEADELGYIEKCRKDWDTGTLFDYGMYRREDGRYLGNVGVHNIRWNSAVAEFGYWIIGEFEGQAYVSESIMALETVLFEHGFHRVEIRCDPTNARSAKIPERLEYLLEGRLRGNSVVNGSRRDTRVYARLRTEAGFKMLADSPST